MEDRLKQLLIVGGMFQPFLLGFEYMDTLLNFFGIDAINVTIASWAVWLLYLMFLLSSAMLFIFPMRKVNKYLIDKHTKTYLALACIGWVPYVSVPLNFMVSYFNNVVPQEWFGFILAYLSFYEICIHFSFLLAIIVVIRKMYDEQLAAKAKKRYKNSY